MALITTLNTKFISEHIVKPSSPTPNHLRSLRASLFDHINVPILMPLIFFFYSQKHTTKIGANDVLDRLKKTLPYALSVFYPLAGRVLDANSISCNDEGVPYVQAEVDKPLIDVAYKAEISQLDKLLPPYGQEGFTALLLAIQVNVFTCGGLAIGVKMSHAISDAFSFVMFVKTWASMVANGNNQYHHNLCGRPCFDIWKLFPPSTPKFNNFDDCDANQNADFIKDRPVSKWFIFSEEKLHVLRSKLFPETNTSTSPNRARVPSLPMVLSAFVWSRIKLSCYNSVNSIPYEVYHAVNLRPRVSPPDDQSYYFGNMVVNAIIKLCTTINDKNISNCQRHFLNQMNESIGKVNNDEFIREMQEGKEDLKFITQHFERESKGDIVALGFSNLRSLRVYEADFGWGKPIWVTSATLMFKNLVIFIPAGPSSNNIVAYINLNSEDMAKLENDKEFTVLVSKAPHATSKL
ncbi:acetyl-CoA-benzylalcohol acetyltransferase-like [Chenopodium quinoa]|uniref:acetyl-CoA-benzylalcohol acetyltransferase-like n=1 Tax=Chenopodium quinoa TaxID=63459 RepID=UPI000B76BE7D|nr:acetyl-CoA-benzylalcohol acetyltransferase-like [Chenopodium quinoa]